MTDERILENKGKFCSFEKRILSNTDVTDEYTDKSVSIKLIDENGITRMLIEAITADYYRDENEICRKGCFIKRFGFCEELINTYFWADFIRAFVTSVRYAMIPCNNEYLCRYSYIWAEKTKGEQCIIAEILGLDKVRDMNESITYLGWLKNSE